MTPDPIPPASPDEDFIFGDLAVTDLDGHTIDELLDYYDADFAPADASIDNSAGCQIALAALRRLRTLTDEFLEDEARTLPPLDESWITGILNQISVQAQAGLNPAKDALIIESSDSPYVNFLVARPDNKDSVAIQKLSKALTSPEVKAFIEKKYSGAVVPAF